MAAAPPAEPLTIPRPEQENVVKAIQRLMQTYPMLERNHIFHEASAQMTRHLIHGVAAASMPSTNSSGFSHASIRHHLDALNKDPSSSET